MGRGVPVLAHPRRTCAGAKSQLSEVKLTKGRGRLARRDVPIEDCGPPLAQGRVSIARRQ